MARRETTPPTKVKRTVARARNTRMGRSGATSVIMQARVDARFAEELLAHDAGVLGLHGPSEVVREGLKLVHRRAQEQALVDAYDKFYSGERAPLPVGVSTPESS